MLTIGYYYQCHLLSCLSLRIPLLGLALLESAQTPQYATPVRRRAGGGASHTHPSQSGAHPRDSALCSPVSWPPAASYQPPLLFCLLNYMFLLIPKCGNTDSVAARLWPKGPPFLSQMKWVLFLSFGIYGHACEISSRFGLPTRVRSNVVVSQE